jgi:hypothetical protein
MRTLYDQPMRGVYVLLLAGCWHGPTGPAEAPAKPAGVLSISAGAFGPIDANTPATLAAIRQAFAGYDVQAINDDNTLEYRVFKGKELLLYVVPDDDGTIFNVHATSGKVSVSDRDWRVGAPFQGASQLTQCECWGENPTCWKQGEHVAVNFARECGELAGGDKRVMRVLDGITVQRIVWSPRAFGTAVHGGEFGGQNYGGSDDEDGN